MLIGRFFLKVINNERKTLTRNHSSMQRIKTVDSSKLTVDKFLIYLLI